MLILRHPTHVGNGQFLERFSRSSPCPVCHGYPTLPRNKGQRCHGYYGGDHAYAHCSREDHAGGLPVEPGGGTFAHLLRGPCHCGTTHGPADAPSPSTRGGKGDGFPSLEKLGNYYAKKLGEWEGWWVYKDRHGIPFYHLLRFKGEAGNKQYRPCHKGDNGRWRLGDPPGPLPLYRLPEILENTDEHIWIFEGEKCCEIARGLGLIATTSAHGANAPQKTDWTPLAGRRVFIVPDHDPDGDRYARTVAGFLAGFEPPAHITFVELPGLDDGEDLAEWVERGGSRDDLLALTKAAKVSPTPILAEANGVTAGLRPAVTSAARAAAGSAAKKKKALSRAPGPAAGGTNQDWSLNDVGNGVRLARMFRDDGERPARWCKLQGCWYVYDGTRWVRDDTDRAVHAAKDLRHLILAEMPPVNDDAVIAAWEGFARASQSMAKIRAALEAARCEPGIAVLPDEFDRSPWLLNSRSGTIDLTTGDLIGHDPAGLHTKLVPVAYDADAACPLWDGFLRKIFGGDAELIAFVQRLCGYFLTGTVRDQIITIAYGEGSNGKSTFFGTLEEILGDYAVKAGRNFLSVKKFDEHPTALAHLAGRRLALAIETGENARLDEVLVKELTGDDTITARRMHQDPWSFRPTHKLVLATNHKPRIRGKDYAIWRRVLLLPFEVTIPKEEADLTFKSKLMPEHPGILRWLVEGCREWQAEGLVPPERVRAAGLEYRRSQDGRRNKLATLRAFLAARCIVLKGQTAVRVSTAALYAAYAAWSEATGSGRMSQTIFGRLMLEEGFTRDKSGDRFYLGVDLLSDDHWAAMDS